MNQPTMEVAVPTLGELGLDECAVLLNDRQTLKKIKEDCDAEIKRIDEEVGHRLDQKEVRTAVWEDYLIIRRQGSKPRPVLDRVMLLEAGVSPQQIKAGTKYGEPGKPGVTVRHISEAKAQRFDDSTLERSESSYSMAPPDGLG